MKYLKIENKGLLDIRLIGLMGGTTKANDVYKIGQFGTGLKYVLSYLIRNNIDFKIFVGGVEIKITTETEVIREQEFNIISIDGKRTSITCQMGHDWKAWMIIREIWCNALDEGGALKEVTDDISGSEGTTTFFIQLTSEIREVLNDWDKYFIHNEQPLFENENFRIYNNKKRMRLYKQGVLIHEDEEHSLFAYDIKGADINELREYKGSPSYDIARALCAISGKIIEYFLENCTNELYEGKMDYDWYGIKFADEWKSTIGNAKLIHQKAVNDIKSRGLDIDLSEVIIVPEKVYKALTKQFEGIGALRVADKINDFYEIHSTDLDLKIKSGLAILETCNYMVSPELKFIYGMFGDKRRLASVSLDKKEVLISERMLDKPMFNVVAMLIEGSEHFNTGLDDCSRPFQQHWIDLYTKTLLDKNKIQL